MPDFSHARLASLRYSIGKMPVLFLNSSANRLEVEYLVTHG